MDNLEARLSSTVTVSKEIEFVAHSRISIFFDFLYRLRLKINPNLNFESLTLKYETELEEITRECTERLGPLRTQRRKTTEEYSATEALIKECNKDPRTGQWVFDNAISDLEASMFDYDAEEEIPIEMRSTYFKLSNRRDETNHKRKLAGRRKEAEEERLEELQELLEIETTYLRAYEEIIQEANILKNQLSVLKEIYDLTKDVRSNYKFYEKARVLKQRTKELAGVWETAVNRIEEKTRISSTGVEFRGRGYQKLDYADSTTSL